jgi:2-dehydro-3-deoxyglucarate aldolase/4-hydroxy-2-oxoheptanedioate aldolase
MAVRLKELVAQSKPTRVFGVGQLCYPKLIEMIGLHGGFDAIWLDQEHAGLTMPQIEQAALAARAAGIDTFVRLAATDYATAMRPLEAGAGGIMAAQVRSAQETEQIVQWTKFQPRGMRGVNSCGIDGRYGTLPFLDYSRRANAETFLAIQIEHRDAVEDVERIAAVPDVDVLFIGPADLSQSLGIAGQWDHPRLWEAIGRVAAAARTHGLTWAILPRDPAYARRCVEMGCRMLSMGLDVWTVTKGLQASLAEYATVFG